ncbi:MAG: hypothetical protein JXM70_10415 [Pirellulales bacterium]|nr:hypothetical protein [Pirellulales bacterium]
MYHAILKISALTFLFALVIGSSTAMAQYGPWGWGPGIGWGAYPATNAMSAKTAIYNQKSANQRQSLAEMNQRHQAQNQFLMTQAQGQSAFASSNSRAAAESFMKGRESRQAIAPSSMTVPLALDPNAAPSAVAATMLPRSTPSDNQSVSQSDNPNAIPYDKIIDWPSLLKASTFRTPRVRIETIMQKAEEGGPGLSENDYNEIVLAVNNMKNSLQRMSEGLNAKEYIGIVNYLDQLTKQAKAAVRR